MAQPAPDLGIPASTSTVNVSIIDTTAILRGVDASKFIQPTIKGHEHLAAPCYSFLIHHPTLDRRLIFDLGIRKDWWNHSPYLLNRFKTSGYHFDIAKNVRDLLDDHGVDPAGIEAIIWSHWHFDHTGDPSTFPPSTALLVGPGFKAAFLPAYPENPDSPLLSASWAGRELRELAFPGASGLRIGRFPALDYFGDGSFYLLDTPGHAVGHVCGLARTTAAPDSFVLMGGDACHHMGQLRPSRFLPLPAALSPHPFCGATGAAEAAVCPGALFDGLLPGPGDRRRPFYGVARGVEPKMHFDEDEAERTVEGVQEADVREDVLVVVAHDEHLKGIVDFFPKTANDFVAKGWVRQNRWTFLKDFSEAVGWTGNVEGKRYWHAPKGGDKESKREITGPI